MALFFDELDEIEAQQGEVLTCESADKDLRPTSGENGGVSGTSRGRADSIKASLSTLTARPGAEAGAGGTGSELGLGAAEAAEAIQLDARSSQLSLQQARQLQVHLVREFAGSEVQERLRLACSRAGDDPDAQVAACEQVGMEAQLRVAMQFGLAPTPSTAEFMSSAFLMYGKSDAEISHRSAVLQWLLHPAAQRHVPIPSGPARCVVYATALVNRSNGEFVCQFEVHLNDNVRALKENVFLVTRIPWHSQKLFIGATELFDQVALSSLIPVAGSVGFRLESRRAEVVSWLQELKKGMGALKRVPAELMSDPEFILPAVQFQAGVLSQADSALRADREFLMRIVPHCGQVLQFLEPELRADRQLVLAAVRHDGWALEFAEAELQEDREIVVAAILQDAEALQFAGPGLRSDAEVVLLATRSDPSVVVRVLPELQKDREAVVRAVRQDWRLLKLVTAEMQADPSVVTAAVRQSGFALQYAAPQRRADREMVLMAVENNGDTLRFAAPELWRDPEVLLAAVRQSGTALGIAPPEAQDLEIAAAAVRQDKRAFVYVASHLRKDIATRFGIDSATEGNPWLEAEDASRGRPQGETETPPVVDDLSGLGKHFMTLSLPDTASKDEIRRRYHQLALQYHPDKCTGDAAVGKQMFQRVLTAYEALRAAFNL